MRRETGIEDELAQPMVHHGGSCHRGDPHAALP